MVCSRARTLIYILLITLSFFLSLIPSLIGCTFFLPTFSVLLCLYLYFFIHLHVNYVQLILQRVLCKRTALKPSITRVLYYIFKFPAKTRRSAAIRPHLTFTRVIMRTYSHAYACHSLAIAYTLNNASSRSYLRSYTLSHPGSAQSSCELSFLFMTHPFSVFLSHLLRSIYR